MNKNTTKERMMSGLDMKMTALKEHVKKTEIEIDFLARLIKDLEGYEDTEAMPPGLPPSQPPILPASYLQSPQQFQQAAIQSPNSELQ